MHGGGLRSICLQIHLPNFPTPSITLTPRPPLWLALGVVCRVVGTPAVPASLSDSGSLCTPATGQQFWAAAPFSSTAALTGVLSNSSSVPPSSVLASGKHALPYSVAPQIVAPHSVAPHSTAPRGIAPLSVAPHSTAPYSSVAAPRSSAQLQAAAAAGTTPSVPFGAAPCSGTCGEGAALSQTAYAALPAFCRTQLPFEQLQQGHQQLQSMVAQR